MTAAIAATARIVAFTAASVWHHQHSASSLPPPRKVLLLGLGFRVLLLLSPQPSKATTLTIATPPGVAVAAAHHDYSRHCELLPRLPRPDDTCVFHA